MKAGEINTGISVKLSSDQNKYLSPSLLVILGPFSDEFSFVFNIVTKRLRHLDVTERWLTPLVDERLDNWARFQLRKAYERIKIDV